MIFNNANDIVDKLFKALLARYQKNLENINEKKIFYF